MTNKTKPKRLHQDSFDTVRQADWPLVALALLFGVARVRSDLATALKGASAQDLAGPALAAHPQLAAMAAIFGRDGE